MELAGTAGRALNPESMRWTRRLSGGGSARLEGERKLDARLVRIALADGEDFAGLLTAVASH